MGKKHKIALMMGNRTKNYTILKNKYIGYNTDYTLSFKSQFFTILDDFTI